MKIRDIDSIKRSWHCCRNSVLFALVVILLQMTQSVVAQQNVALCPEKPKLVLMLVVYALRQKLILDPVSRFLTRLFLHHK